MMDDLGAADGGSQIVEDNWMFMIDSNNEEDV